MGTFKVHAGERAIMGGVITIYVLLPLTEETTDGSVSCEYGS